jgi:para-nitrobenzyl esterase
MTTRLVLALVSLTFTVVLAAGTGDPDRVKIASGPIAGTIEDGVRIFKGVPLAKPPVGELRWMAPQPISWTASLDATQFQKPCPQPVSAGRANGGGVSGPTAEDCLYLNVWAPAGAKNAPVMLWLYGGAGYLGGAHLAGYHGTTFAKRGVMLVTMNYRLGALGNFAHPALTKAAGAKDPLGSYALMDAVAGLQWIKQNAAVFGGDPSNVTLFGQSAGGAMVSSLLSTPSAKGLFHKAIIHSGASLGDLVPLEKAEAQGATMATALGLNGAAATIAELRGVPAQATVDHMQVRQGVRAVLDGRFRTTSTRAGFASGATFDVPLIVGSNAGEGGADRANEMVNLAAAGAPSYQYYFTYVPEARKAAQPNGPPHSAEIRYAFGTVQGAEITDADRAAASRMNSCWVAFAKAPAGARALTCSDGFTWEPRTQANDAIAVFGETTTLGKAAAIVEDNTKRNRASQR